MARDLSGVLDAVLAGIVVADVSGRIELVNAAACRILETSAEACREQPIESLQGEGHAIARLGRSALETGCSASESEQTIERRLDDALEVEVTASPLFERDGSTSGVVLLVRDHTILRSLEERVAERESLSVLGRIAAGIAHEVKNPLGGIRGAAEILSARTEDPKARDAAGLIVREVDRIAALVDDLMVFNQGEDLRLAEANIHFVLDSVLDLLVLDPISADIQLHREFDPSIPEFLADADRLTQVFLNLARNAVQAMGDDGGALTIRTRMTLDHRLSTPSGDRLPTLLVEFADTGPGIASEVIERLATPFFSTKPGGTGLGLAVSRQWVSRHGGSLRIESLPGEGATVRVALPLRRKA